ncbi:MAG TPA: FAD-binding oxidoreductase [Candidatus Saccharimonadales bacterium]|nr:FAD-binding oxidoreductase [Candidatus Saccharimonadales bacterium]
MKLLKQEIKAAGISCEIDDSQTTLENYSHDASLFEVRPKIVVSPKSADDLKKLIRFVSGNKTEDENLSITARSGGTCMSGGAINDSIIVDFAKNFSHIKSVSENLAVVEPGVFYRDFETATLKKNAIMPSFPASREICTIGGMVANDAGGEKSLSYGKTINYVSSLKAVLADGNEYSIRPLNLQELNAKMKDANYEGQIYKKVYELIDNNNDLIQRAKPKVSKNSTGYNLWDVWNRDSEVFDLTKLFVGSQGTLGLVTEVGLKLVPAQEYSGVLVCFMKKTDELGEVINTVLEHHPASFESFDNYTLKLSLKFFPYFRKTLGWKGLFKLAVSLLPDVFIFMKGVPKLILLVEFNGTTQKEVDEKIKAAHIALNPFKLEAVEEDNTEAKAWKFRIMRRESFNLLRKKVKNKHTAPFIDDLVVPPKHLPEFLPKLRKIINKYKLLATVAGHMGDGNFHIIPLMELEKKSERDKLLPAMKEINELVLGYGGSLSGEHNDGLIRGPWLKQMYGEKVYELFKQTKEIFDPDNIFNPHKKTDADWQWSYGHIRDNFT